MKKKIVVPEGMLKDAMSAREAAFMGDRERITDILEAALRWLSENPIMPTHYQIEEMQSACGLPVFAHHGFERICTEWQRRMFIAPEESGVPEEVKDLLLDESQERRTDFRGANVSSWARPFINEAILEAYRRGKESK